LTYGAPRHGTSYFLICLSKYTLPQPEVNFSVIETNAPGLILTEALRFCQEGLRN